MGPPIWSISNGPLHMVYFMWSISYGPIQNGQFQSGPFLMAHLKRSVSNDPFQMEIIEEIIEFTCPSSSEG